MKTEIITKEKPKEFEPFKLVIEIESEVELRWLYQQVGDMSGSLAHQLYNTIKSKVESL